MFDVFRKRIARIIAPARRRGPAAPARAKPAARTAPVVQTRMYQAAKSSRLTSGWASQTTSADSELVSSLRQLIQRSRALVRDSAYAKRAKVIVQNNVVGAGIGLQAQVMSSRGTLREDINDAIENTWREWCCAEDCHTGGTLHFSDMERVLMGQVFEAGEVFIRKHYRAFGDEGIPFALEVIESERMADELQYPTVPGAAAPGTIIKMGIEQDAFGRPLAYWVRQRHPGEYRWAGDRPDLVERVPASQIIHLRLVERWPQTRGEPWLHAVARKLNDMDGYTEAEITAARGAANYMATIESADPNTPLAEPKSDGTRELALEPGMVETLLPGEKLNFVSPNRPNAALDPFMRYMLREVAAGVGVSYESISRDYSQSNYSSSRLALLDDRDLWRMLQQWFIRSFRNPLHKEWLQAAVLSGSISGIRVDEYAIDPKKFEAVAFKPRGWSWVDPTKEVAAYKEAVKAGFTTVADVIANTGGGQDIEDILRQRRRELDMMDELDLEFDTSPEVYIAAETGGTAGAGIAPASDDASSAPDAEDAGDAESQADAGAPKRVFSIRRHNTP